MFQPNIFELQETQYSFQKARENDLKPVSPLLNFLLKAAENRLMRPFTMGLLYPSSTAVATMHTLGELQLHDLRTELEGTVILNSGTNKYTVNGYRFSSSFNTRPDFQETDSAEIKPFAANILYPAIHFAEPIGSITRASVKIEAESSGRKSFKAALTSMTGTMITTGTLVRK